MRRGLLPILFLIALAAALVAGCGGDDGGGGGEGASSRPASDPSEFPAAKGQSLEQVLQQNATGEGPVVAPAARVLRQGTDRFSFGVFTPAKEQITDADVAIYAAPKDLKGPAIGPFPARIEDLSTEPAFRARTTSEDPDAAKVVYVTDIPLDQPGKWAFGALTKQGDGYGASLVATPSLVGQFDPVGAGDMAPKVHTPTTSDVGDISQIDTRVPADTMHDTDLADVLGKKPVVLVFATPALCQSRICGPVVDVAEQVKRDHEGDDIAFIHQEVYVDNDLSKGEVPQMQAYGLNSEPWLYVIDREGKVSTVIEGAYSVAELEAAVQKVLGMSESELLDMLAAETDRRTDTICEGVKQLAASGAADSEKVEALRVEVHGIKGAALMVGQHRLATVGGWVEDTLADHIESGEIGKSLGATIVDYVKAIQDGAHAAATGEDEPSSIGKALDQIG